MRPAVWDLRPATVDRERRHEGISVTSWGLDILLRKSQRKILLRLVATEEPPAQQVGPRSRGILDILLRVIAAEKPPACFQIGEIATEGLLRNRRNRGIPLTCLFCRRIPPAFSKWGKSQRRNSAELATENTPACFQMGETAAENTPACFQVGETSLLRFPNRGKRSGGIACWRIFLRK